MWYPEHTILGWVGPYPSTEDAVILSDRAEFIEY